MLGCGRAVRLGLPLAEQVEVWPVQDGDDRACHLAILGTRIAPCGYGERTPEVRERAASVHPRQSVKRTVPIRKDETVAAAYLRSTRHE